MRIAALYDIHGNQPALDAVLAEVRAARVDQIVVGGDVVPGPMCREVLDALRELRVVVHYILGNGEVAVLEEMAGRVSLVPAVYREAFQWIARDLEKDYGSTIASWPKMLALPHPDLGSILFCHATPRNENEIFTRLTPEDLLVPVFAGVEAPVVVCGHTHMQFDRHVGPTRVVNAGSVGMPFGRTGADWLLLSDKVELRHVDYDLEAAARRIRAAAYPQAEEFAAKYLLDPPTEAAILEAYGKAELRS